MIQFNDVSKIFKSDLLTHPFTALDKVSFEIPRGSMVGFLGANGAGKTTSLKIIMDFIRPTSGEVKFDPSLGATKIDVFKKIGFLPERPYFHQNLTGHEFLKYMGKLSELTSPEINERVEKWAPRFKIGHALDRELKTYSKGMLQRIGFMASILHDPEIIILDEPLSGLDPIGRKELKDVIIEIHKSGKTVFFSSHIVPDIEEICDRVIFLSSGKLVYDGPVHELMKIETGQDFMVTIKAETGLPELSGIKNAQRLPDQTWKFLVNEEQKDTVMLELLKRNVHIQSLDPVRPSLEEIFYKTKGSYDLSKN